jgi:stringent starvation protein B
MSDVPRPLPPKKDVALALLEREPSVFVHLDPRRPGVAVPKWFTGQPQLVLQIGLNMPIPIHDLKVSDEGISCTLSFSRTPFWCRLPWHAIWALVGEDQRGMVWPDDIPPELTVQKQKGAAPQQKEKPSKRPRARLAAVDPGGAPPAEEARSSKPPRPRLEIAPPAPAEAGEPGSASGDEAGASPEARPASGKPKRELPPYLRVIK